MRNFSILLLFLSVILVSCQNNIKVACIGDSITHGGGKDKAASFYPMLLDQMLGDSYEVLNCGDNGATMQTDGDRPYWYGKDLPNVFVYKPNVIVIMLGTNDSKTPIWNAASFERDYQLMIDSLKTLETNPEILLCSPPPAYTHYWEISDSTIQNGVIPIVSRIAKKNNLKVIDVYNSMSEMSDLFHDGIHPTGKGKKILAETIAKVIQK